MYLFYDIGGSRTRLAISSTNQKHLLSWVAYPTPQDFVTGLNMLQTHARQLVGEQKLVGIIGGMAGEVNNFGVLVKSPNLPDWINRPFVSKLKKAFNCPVENYNDCVLAGFAEVRPYSKKINSKVAYVTLSTGIGGKLFLGGLPYEPELNFEPGKQLVMRNFSDLNSNIEFVSLESVLSGKALFSSQVSANTRFAKTLNWKIIGKITASGLYNLVVFWRPSVIVLGGGVILNQPAYYSSIKQEFVHFASSDIRPVKLQLAKYKDLSVIYGALQASGLRIRGRNWAL